MFKKLIEILKAHPRKIVFTEGADQGIKALQVPPDHRAIVL